MTPDASSAALPELQDADVALRCAWLREHGHLLLSVDPSGLLSAQLWDFADLLEAVQCEGWLR